MSSVRSIDDFRGLRVLPGGALRTTQTYPLQAEADRLLAENMSLDVVLLPGECAQGLKSLTESLVEQHRPATAMERQLVFRMVMAGWALSRLDRLNFDDQDPNAVQALFAATSRRETLIWDWHQALTQLRQLRKGAPQGPRPPAASRLAVISSQDREDPIGPDRRGPREPTLPTWLPQAA